MEGQLVHKRSLSKNILFFDVVPGINVGKSRVSAVFKVENTSPEFMDKVRRGKNKLKVGDIVRFNGCFESENKSFLVSDYEIVRSWNHKVDGGFLSIPPTEVKKSSKVSEGISRHRRARVFAQWIEETFGSSRTSLTVLDVAGGRGDLSFELSVRRTILSYVVDPRSDAGNRELTYKNWQKKIAKDTGRSIPPPFREKFDEDFFIKHKEWILNNVDLIVGLHPDEATESIVDLSLEYKINFAIIPCCIFAAENPHRRLFNGSVPNTYETFISYLSEKNLETIHQVELQFGGRNKVLYTNSSAHQNERRS